MTEWGLTWGLGVVGFGVLFDNNLAFGLGFRPIGHEQHTGPRAFLSKQMTKEPSPMQECPRFPSCSVNHCPLDPEQERHLGDVGDRERKCPMEKGVRQRIGSKYPDLLPMLGFTAAEVAGRARWERKTPREREAFAERGRLLLSKHGKA